MIKKFLGFALFLTVCMLPPLLTYRYFIYRSKQEYIPQTVVFGPSDDMYGRILRIKEIEVIPHEHQPYMEITVEGGWKFVGCCGDSIKPEAYKEIARLVSECQGAKVSLITPTLTVSNNRMWDVEVILMHYGKAVKLSEWIKEKNLNIDQDDRIPNS